MNTIYSEVLSLYEDICAQFERGFSSCKVNSTNRAIVTLHAIKGFRQYKAIVELAKIHHSLEGNVLLRSLLNLCFNIKWMLNMNTEERFKRYTDYYSIYQESGIKSLLKHGQIERHDLLETMGRIDLKNQGLRNKYKKKNKLNKKDWSGISIAEMADEINMTWFYQVLYKELSNHEHVNSIISKDYFDVDSNGNAILLPFENNNEECDQIMMAGLIFSKIVDSYNGFMGVNIRIDEVKFEEIQTQLLKNIA